MIRPSLYQDTDTYKVHIYNSHEEWLKGRSKGIGGSSASSLIDMNPWKDNNTLWKEHKGIIIPDDISDKPFVKYGNDVEPIMRDLFSINHPEYEMQYLSNTTIQSIKNDFMTYSPDGLLLEKETEKKGVWECKSTNILQSMQKEKWNEQIPDNYFIQVLHGLLVLDFDFVWLTSIRKQYKRDNNENMKPYQIVEDYYFTREEVQDQLDWLEQEEKDRWNKYYINDVEPPTQLNF